MESDIHLKGKVNLCSDQLSIGFSIVLISVIKMQRMEWPISKMSVLCIVVFINVCAYIYKNMHAFIPVGVYMWTYT